MERQFFYQSDNYVADLNDLRLRGQLCDVTIKVNETQFCAHKVILALRLKYFKSLFLDEVHANKKVVTLKNVKESNVESLILFAYTGEILITENNALSLLEDSHRLNESGIKKACINFLEKHLSPKYAAQALEVAESINCFELKIIARKIVPMNFKDLSRSPEYMSLDYESLKSLLSASEMQTDESQKMFFEGILKWIMHDIENRRIHLSDLLSFVDITQLTVQYLWEYLRDNVADTGNDGIVIDIMAIHSGIGMKSKDSEDVKSKSTVSDTDSKKNFEGEEKTSDSDSEKCVNEQQANSSNSIDYDKVVLRHKSKDKHEIRMKLMITNMCDNTAIQFYDFSQAEWSGLCMIESTDNSTSKSGAILNDKLYYVQSTRLAQDIMQEHLRVIDYRTEECTTLDIRRNNLSGGAVCSCDRYLYICGGITEMNQVTSRVQRYNPITNDIVALGPLITERCGAAAIIYQGCLHVLGGRNRLEITNSVEKFDLNAMKWMSFPSMCEPRRQCAVAILNGKLYACGGQKIKSAEVYDPEVKRWQPIASMSISRYGFLMIAHDGKLIAIGGDRLGTIEIYDPCKDEWQMDERFCDGLSLRNPIGGFIQSR